MARLLPLVVAAAVIVPTAVLGGGRLAPDMRQYTSAQVVRAFAADGIVLSKAGRSEAYPSRVELAGRLLDGTRLDVIVIAPQKTGGGGWAFSELVATGSSVPTWEGSGMRGNVVAGWFTSGSCADQAVRVRAALDRLGPPGGPDSVSCHPLDYP